MLTTFSRRGLLRSTATAAGFLGLHGALSGRLYADDSLGYGPLIPDPDGLLDLPRGFKYRAFSRTGEVMSDGFQVPGAHDGMAAFAGPSGLTLLVRNHEMSVAAPGATGSPYPNAAAFQGTSREMIYDAGSLLPASGGTTNLLFNTRTLEVESHVLSLTGTIRNCAGGPTPWGTWLTCEETGLRAGQTDSGSVLTKDHGWVFEVRATSDAGIQKPEPLRALGRFSHEAVAVHPATGIVYMTEDQGNSVFYRFVPDSPGNLQSGRVQALRFRNRGYQDTRNFSGPTIPAGVEFDVEWFDLTETESPRDDLRVRAAGDGAAIFAREEGCWWGNGFVYFACTSGGTSRLGQIFKYAPSQFEGTSGEAGNPPKLQLFIEPTDESQFAAPDNICVASWGDVVVCEDGSGDEFVHGVTPSAGVYKIARNALNSSEFAGSCFSPDESVLFVNMQSPGITFAIKGPWQRRAGLR